MPTMPPSALALARPPFPADAVSPEPPPFSAATRLAARPMRCRLFLPLPSLYRPPPLLPPPLLFPLASLSTPPLLLFPLLLPLFLLFFRSSFLTALRSDLFCSRTLTSPSPSISCASSVTPPPPPSLLSFVAAADVDCSSFPSSVVARDAAASFESSATESALDALVTSDA